MKRTKTINHASFRKSWNARHLTPVALAVTAVFMLAGCEKNDETVSLYQNADDCSAATGQAAECKTAYTNALKEAERTAPKYASREDCVAEFGEGQCQQTPAQAGMAPENQAQAQSSRVVSGGQLTQATRMAGSMPAAKAVYSTVPPDTQGYGGSPWRARADCTRHSTIRKVNPSGVSSTKSNLLMRATKRASRQARAAAKPPPSPMPRASLARSAS